MILAPMEYTAEDIEKNTVHLTLSISIGKAKSLCTNVSKIWTH